MRMRVACGLLLVAACSSGARPPGGDDDDGAAPDARHAPSVDAPAPEIVPYPDPDWPTATPGDVGLDAAKLDEASAQAAGTQSYCLLVIRHGKLVSEHYYNGATAATTPPSWSIAKSYTGTTVGIALEAHDLPGLDAKIADHVTSWQGSARASIALRDLVSMTSGLSWSIFSDYVELAELMPDKSDFAVGRDADAASGTTWAYNNAAVQVIEPYFRAVTGETIEQYAHDHLWAKIGSHATWAHDSAGHPTTYANVLATCRDHARLGYLYLHGGKWKDEQVVPAAWVAAATTPSQTFNRGYGYLWWNNSGAPTMNVLQKVSTDRIQPYAPADLFAAHGFGGQFIDVIPSLDLVVVRFGEDSMSAGTTRDVGQITQALADDELSDTHQKILQPILDSVH